MIKLKLILNTRGISITEILVVAGILSMLGAVLINFFIGGFRGSAKAGQAVDAIMEMSMVLQYLRHDLRTVTEDLPALPITVAKTSTGDFSSLSFYIVAGVTRDGAPVLTPVLYRLENSSLIRTAQSINQQGELAPVEEQKIIDGKITDIHCNLFDNLGNDITDNRTSTEVIPRKINLMIQHEFGEKLETYVTIYSTYLRIKDAGRQSYAWKNNWTFSPRPVTANAVIGSANISLDAVLDSFTVTTSGLATPDEIFNYTGGKNLPPPRPRVVTPPPPPPPPPQPQQVRPRRRQ